MGSGTALAMITNLATYNWRAGPRDLDLKTSARSGMARTLGNGILQRLPGKHSSSMPSRVKDALPDEVRESQLLSIPLSGTCHDRED
jgi:hypothetical protein